MAEFFTQPSLAMYKGCQYKGPDAGQAVPASPYRPNVPPAAGALPMPNRCGNDIRLPYHRLTALPRFSSAATYATGHAQQATAASLFVSPEAGRTTPATLSTWTWCRSGNAAAVPSPTQAHMSASPPSPVQPRLPSTSATPCISNLWPNLCYPPVSTAVTQPSQLATAAWHTAKNGSPQSLSSWHGIRCLNIWHTARHRTSSQTWRGSINCPSMASSAWHARLPGLMRGYRSRSTTPVGPTTNLSWKEVVRSPRFGILSVTALATALMAYRFWFTAPDVSGLNVYMDFESEGENLGRVVIGLHEKFAPDVAENFRGLASGDAGHGYQGSIVHRVVRNYTLMAGDITNNDGSGGHAYRSSSFSPIALSTSRGIVGSLFSGNSRPPRHTRGAVSMVVEDPGRGGAVGGEQPPGVVRSQFFIACMSMPPEIDRSMLVFGRVLSGMEVVDKISCRPTDTHNRPLHPIRVSECGVVAA